MSIPIYDSWDTSYKSIFGTLKRAEYCKFRLRLPADTVGEPVLVIYRLGFKVKFVPMRRVESEDGTRLFETSYSPNFVGVHHYYFSVLERGERLYIKRENAHIGSFEGNELFQLTVYDNVFTAPDFIKGGIMYQIFPDRFYKSGKHHENVPSDRIMREDWGAIPSYIPSAQGRYNNDYFGGDLAGIMEKLPYLYELGVTCIYLNPIFEAHENHRYNTADYMKVDPLLGTNEDFKRLCEVALEYGIYIILDGVFNHTGDDSVYFNKRGRYDSLGAYNSKESPYYPWYSFHNYPDEYESWWGISTLPNVNELNDDYLSFICGDDGVLNYWISLGAQGYRLDVADELPDKFLDKLRKSVKSAGQDKIIIGEVWEDASNKESYGIRRRYLLGDQLDSVMNYPFKDAILSYIAGGKGESFRDHIMTIVENYPKPAMDTAMNILSTHDTIRAITVLAGEPVNGRDRAWQAQQSLSAEQYKLGESRLKCAMVLQFFLPGVPCIYYGDEAGMEGYSDPFSRKCYPWGNENSKLVAFTKELADIRHSLPVLAQGSLKPLYFSDDLVVFARISDKDCVITALNKSQVEQEMPADILAGFSEITIKRGNSQSTIPPYDYIVLSATKKAEH